MIDELIVIPARYASSRFPAKALAMISGKPMILRTIERCLEVVEKSSLLVATDDERIAEVVRSVGVNVEMTSDAHPTGTDRVAEVASRIKAKTYINVQGDEPCFNPDDLRKLIAAARENRNISIIGRCDTTSEEEWRDPHTTKLVFSFKNELIYIGRAAIPGSKSGKYSFGHRQVCLHAYPAEALKAFHEFGGKTKLEEHEDHEMIRFLELGLKILVIPMSSDSIPVDRPGDVLKVETALRARGIT